MLHSCEREGDEFINESKIITVTHERGLFYHSIVLSIILDKIVKIDLKKNFNFKIDVNSYGKKFIQHALFPNIENVTISCSNSTLMN